MIEYIVKENERMVIATLKGCSEDAINILNRRLRSTKFLDCLTDFNKVYSRYLIPNKFSSAVKCDPRDEFDVEEGKRKAKERLLVKYHRSFERAIVRYVDDMTFEASMIATNLIDKVDDENL